MYPWCTLLDPAMVENHTWACKGRMGDNMLLMFLKSCESSAKTTVNVPCLITQGNRYCTSTACKSRLLFLFQPVLLKSAEQEICFVHHMSQVLGRPLVYALIDVLS